MSAPVRPSVRSLLGKWATGRGGNQSRPAVTERTLPSGAAAMIHTLLACHELAGDDGAVSMARLAGYMTSVRPAWHPYTAEGLEDRGLVTIGRVAGHGPAWMVTVTDEGRRELWRHRTGTAASWIDAWADTLDAWKRAFPAPARGPQPKEVATGGS